MIRTIKQAAVVSALLGAWAAAPPGGQADTAAPGVDTSCEAAVHLSEAAETRMGGALYEGPMESPEAMAGTMGAMPEMAGAHEVHRGQRGGVFFMAPNKVHHIEARYSRACGLQLFLYNAFTEPIRVDRFQAFYRIIPEDDMEWEKEVIRFLSPRADGGVLQASGEHDIEGRYKIELYVKFPESDDAQLFNVPAESTDH